MLLTDPLDFYGCIEGILPVLCKCMFVSGCVTWALPEVAGLNSQAHANIAFLTFLCCLLLVLPQMVVSREILYAWTVAPDLGISGAGPQHGGHVWVQRSMHSCRHVLLRPPRRQRRKVRPCTH